MWQYTLLIATAAVLTFQSLFAKLYSNNYTGEDKFSSPVFSVLYGLSVALITLAVSGFSFSPSLFTVITGLLNGVFLFLYNFSLIEGARRGPYSIVIISAIFGGVLVPMFVMFFMPYAVELLVGKESSLWFTPQSFSVLQLVAMVIVLVAFVLLNLKGGDQGRSKKYYYFWVLLIALVNGGYGTVLALQAQLRPDDRSEVLVLTYAFAGVISFVYLVFLARRKQVFSRFRMPSKALFFALGACVIASLASNLSTYILTLFDNAAIVNATSNGCILIFTALAAYLLFKERMNWKQLLGAALCVVSLVLLNF